MKGTLKALLVMALGLSVLLLQVAPHDAVAKAGSPVHRTAIRTKTTPPPASDTADCVPNGNTGCKESSKGVR